MIVATTYISRRSSGTSTIKVGIACSKDVKGIFGSRRRLTNTSEFVEKSKARSVRHSIIMNNAIYRRKLLLAPPDIQADTIPSDMTSHAASTRRCQISISVAPQYHHSYVIHFTEQDERDECHLWATPTTFDQSIVAMVRVCQCRTNDGRRFCVWETRCNSIIVIQRAFSRSSRWYHPSPASSLLQIWTKPALPINANVDGNASALY